MKPLNPVEAQAKLKCKQISFNLFENEITYKKENAFKMTKERSRRYSVHTITDADYTDDIALLANTPAKAETLLKCLERAAASIGFHINAHKSGYMCLIKETTFPH